MDPPPTAATVHSLASMPAHMLDEMPLVMQLLDGHRVCGEVRSLYQGHRVPGGSGESS